MFDPDWYLRRYTDVQAAGAEPLEHYLLHGWREKREPGGVFRADFYIRANPDVAARDINPLLHFCVEGWKEGRLPMPGFDIESYGKARSAGALSMQDAMRFAPSVETMVEGSDDLIAISGSGLFDAAYYLERYPEAKASGNPLGHYLVSGAAAGHDPSAWFSTRYYLKRYPDVAGSSINPFRHYCNTGWKELRNPSDRLDAAWFFLSNLDRFGRDGNAFLEALRLGLDGMGGVRAAENYSVNDRVRLLAMADDFLSMADADREFIPAVAELCVRLNGFGHAATAYRLQLQVASDAPALRRRLIEVLSAKGDWQSVAEESAILLQHRGDDLLALKSLGDAKAKMRDANGACEAYERYLAIAYSEQVAYDLGVVYESVGRDKDAQDCYHEVVARSKSANTRAYGIGVYHQAKKNHVLAIAAYERELEARPLDPEILFRLGHSSEQAYLWREAMQAYRRAIALRVGKPKPEWHYRCGVVAERLCEWETAAGAYMVAIDSSQSPDKDWHYRLGFALDQLGRHHDACLAYLGVAGTQDGSPSQGWKLPGKSPVEDSLPGADLLNRYFAELEEAMAAVVSLGRNKTIPGVHVGDGNRHLMAGRYEEAARAYLRAAERTAGHPAEFYRSAGLAFEEAGMHEEGCRALRLERVSQRASSVVPTERDKSEANRQLAAYVEYSRNLPLDDSLVMYESFSGLSMSCNPLAIYRELLADPGFRDFRHVWVVDDPARVPDELKSRDDLIVVKRESDAYLRYLSTAGYLINNSGFSPYFIRKEGQKYLATWHGTPLKTLGKEQKYKFYDHKRTQRNLLQATHVISPNAHTTSVLLDSYDIRQVFGGKFAETGYPRVDSTLTLDDASRGRLRERMSLSADRPVVLYAPTWRGTPDEVHFDFSKLESDLRMMSVLDCQVVFRGHSWLERAVNVKDIDFTVVPSDIDTNDLLSIVDVLVTDYSSVFFDFMATGRPIAYYVYDLEQYEAERGMYFDMEEMPGPKCRTIEELCASIQFLLEGRGGEGLEAQHAEAARRFNSHDDGGATRRVIDFFFKDDASSQIGHRTSDKPSILLYGGNFDGGPETERVLAFAASIDPDAFDLAIVFNPTTIEAIPGGIRRFRMLPPGIIGIPRYGNVPMTPEERDLRRQHESGKPIAGEAGRRMLREVYDREMRRMVADWTPDHIVVIQGQDRFWPSLLLDNGLDSRKFVLSRPGQQWLDGRVVSIQASDSVEQDAMALATALSSAARGEA
ncbi:MAG: CDP-glycerol glycerophosphotransferase family protein [Luteimonas sp.]|nr:CDP-glycerol glycerophosphotransferase family protein [Luteimonas sp.]